MDSNNNNSDQNVDPIRTIVETISDSEAYMQQKLATCQKNLSNHIRATQQELKRNLQLNTIFGITILIALVIFWIMYMCSYRQMCHVMKSGVKLDGFSTLL